MRCIPLKKSEYRQYPLTYLGGRYTHPRLLTLLDIVGIGIVRRANKYQIHCVISDKDWNEFHADFTYAFANNYIRFESLMLKLKFKYVENFDEN